MSNKNKGFIGISVYKYFKIDYLQVQVNNLKKYYYFCKLYFINIYLFLLQLKKLFKVSEIFKIKDKYDQFYKNYLQVTIIINQNVFNSYI